MQNHFNNQFNQDNRGQGNRQQFMQQMRDTTPHNFIQKTDQDMYGQNTGYNQYQNQPQNYNHRPFQSYGVSSNDRPAVVSQGGCCCSIMWSDHQSFLNYCLSYNILIWQFEKYQTSDLNSGCLTKTTIIYSGRHQIKTEFVARVNTFRNVIFFNPLGSFL